MSKSKYRVKPNPGTEHLFDPGTGKLLPVVCPSTAFINLNGCIHHIECQVPEDSHPNQPHMARIEETEAFVDAFVGWWDVPLQDVDPWTGATSDHHNTPDGQPRTSPPTAQSIRDVDNLEQLMRDNP